METMHLRPLTPEVAGNGIDLLQIFRVLWASRRTIIAVTLLAVSLALVYCFVATPIFRSESALKLLQQQYEMERLNEKKESMFLGTLDEPHLPVVKFKPNRRWI